MSTRATPLTADLVLRAYQAGLFPMAESRDARLLHWLEPSRRGILPLEHFHAPRRLLRTVRQGIYQVSSDQDFPATLAACAAPAPGREETWINSQIEHAMNDLHIAGYAHSVECRSNGELVGGLYGVAVGAAFFGESMFSRARDASKVALVHLVARLRLGGFHLLDTQFVTTHLTQFGATDIPRNHYRSLLQTALRQSARYPASPPQEALVAVIAALAS